MHSFFKCQTLDQTPSKCSWKTTGWAGLEMAPFSAEVIQTCRRYKKCTGALKTSDIVDCLMFRFCMRSWDPSLSWLLHVWPRLLHVWGAILHIYLKKMFSFKAFAWWITKEAGAQHGEKDKCYLQGCIYWRKSKVQTIHCSKQMWHLLSAINLPKGNHTALGKFTFLRFGLDLEEKCSICSLLDVGFLQKKMLPNVVKRTNAVGKRAFITFKKKSRLHCSKQIRLLYYIAQRGTAQPWES